MKKPSDLQVSLLDGFDAPVGRGEPMSAKDTAIASGQRAQVEAIMADGAWHTLPGLVNELKRHFGKLYLQTSTSARLRDLGRKGYTVERERTRPGSNLYQYRAVRA